MRLGPEEYCSRRDKLRDSMADANVDGALAWGEPRGSLGLLSTRNDIGYLVGWPITQPGSGPVLLVFPQNGNPTLLVSGPEYALEYAQRETMLTDVCQCDPNQFAQEAARVLKEVEIGNDNITVGVVDNDSLPKWLTRDLEHVFPEMMDITQLIDTHRARKSSLQVERLRSAAEVTDLMFKELETVAGVGTAPKTIMEELELVARSAGAEFANVWISSSSLDGGVPIFNRQPNSPSFESGDLVVCGIHVIVDNYWGHAIRPVTIGEPTERHRDLFNLLDRVREVVLDGTEPGTAISDLYSDVQKVYKAAGYQSSFRTIHGLGLRYGGPPYFPQPGMNPDGAHGTLETGMVFELHPNVRDIDDGALCAIGDAILVTEEGPEVLNRYPAEPMVV